MKRLTERDAYWLGEEFWTSAREPDDEKIDMVYEKLKDYEDLEEQGLLLKLPCKANDVVYVPHENIVHPFVVRNISINKYEITFRLLYMGAEPKFKLWEIVTSKFNELFFITREEAEAKLK